MTILTNIEENIDEPETILDTMDYSSNYGSECEFCGKSIEEEKEEKSINSYI